MYERERICYIAVIYTNVLREMTCEMLNMQKDRPGYPERSLNNS